MVTVLWALRILLPNGYLRVAFFVLPTSAFELSAWCIPLAVLPTLSSLPGMTRRVRHSILRLQGHLATPCVIQ